MPGSSSALVVGTLALFYTSIPSSAQTSFAQISNAVALAGLPIATNSVKGNEAVDKNAVDDSNQNQTRTSQTTTPQTAPETQDRRDEIYYPGDTEHVKPLARKLFFNILLDQREIWTSPFRMHSKDAKWWIAFGAVTAALIATDHKTINTFRNSQGQITWGNNLSKIGASYTLLPLVAGFYTYGVLRDDPKPREVGVLGAEALIDSLIVVQILKPIAGRVRPDASGERSRFFDGGDSFPSGHAITTFAIASIIGHEYGHTKVVPIVAYGLATAVSLSRFAAQRHFASDIFVGAAMGWFIGRYVYRTHMDHAIHRHWKPKVVPQFQPSERSYGVALIFSK